MKRLIDTINAKQIILCEEKLAEKERKEEFPSKFPGINEIPLVRIFVRWCYKEGWWYSLGLLCIVFIGLALRLKNLTILGPNFDETFHLLAGKLLLESGHTTYTRALLVSWSVALFYLIGNPSSFYGYLFWGRIPGAIFGALTAIPLYFLAKRISKPIGIISAILWITSPWAIGISRNIREYAYYPFFILLAALIFIKLMELLIDFKSEDLNKILIYTLFTSIFIYYAYHLSTLRLSLVIFPTIFIYLILANTKKIHSILRNNKKHFFVFFILFTLLVGFTIFVAATSYFVRFDSLAADKIWLNFFMMPKVEAPMQWWSGSNLHFVAYFLTGLGVIYALVSKKREYFMHLLIFASFIVFFTFFFGRYTAPKYISYALPFFVIIISSGIYSMVSLIKYKYVSTTSRFLKFVAVCIIILFIWSIFNPLNTFSHLTANKQGVAPTTGLRHYEVSNTLEFLEKNTKKEDYFVSTFFINIIPLCFNVPKSRIRYLNPKDKEKFEEAKRLIKEKKQGYIIVTHYRRKRLRFDGTPARMIFNKDGIQIYRWKNK